MTLVLIGPLLFLLITGISLMILKVAGNNDRNLIRIPVRTDEEESVQQVKVR